MKKIVSILFLMTMLLQAMPVLHFFAEKPEIFYTSIDEEKPSEKGKETKEGKQCDEAVLNLHTLLCIELVTRICFQNYTSQLPFSPHLEMLTPPPNFC